MGDINLFAVFIERIETIGIDYFIGGSVASIVYGEPRLTNDIDLIFHLNKTQVEKLVDNFSIEQFYLPPKEVMLSELSRGEKGHFNIIHNESGFKADIYFVGNDPLQLWALNNFKKIEFMNLDLPIAPPEYIIVKKLLFYKEGKSQKHIEDIKGILKESEHLINFETLNRFLEDYKVNEIYRELFN